ncbi:MAG: hypothetical protein P8X95_10355 [Anaerolineales bacterium]|jgi:hypothetical protein
MDSNVQLMSTMESIAVFLAAFPALWIASQIVLRNYSGDDRATQLFLWLALGGLILTPLTDFLHYFSSLLSLIIPSLRNSGMITVFLGVGPFLLFSTITLILGIFVYGLALYDGRTIIAEGAIPLIQGLKFSRWESGFVLLGIAGLINQMVSGLVVRFVSIYLPNLTAQQGLAQLSMGFWISWLVALIILLVTLFVMRERIHRTVDEPPL